MRTGRSFAGSVHSGVLGISRTQIGAELRRIHGADTRIALIIPLAAI